MWCVLCEISGDYVQVKDFRSKEEAEEYAEQQEMLGLLDFVSCYKINSEN